VAAPRARTGVGIADVLGHLGASHAGGGAQPVGRDRLGSSPEPAREPSQDVVMGTRAAGAADVQALATSIRDVGYVVVRDALGVRAVEELRAAFGPATPGSTSHVEVDERTPASDRWLSLAEQPVVSGLLTSLLGTYEVTVHGRDPGEGAGAQGLHADRPAGRVHDVDAVTVLWMLDDFLDGNGATRVVPRSHRGAAAVPRHLARPGLRHTDQIVVTGRPGDALVLDAHLWHSGQENTSGRRRRAVQMVATRSSLVFAGWAHAGADMR
jgi:ectoine hydroxylase-related dioxygenase (phytanoyl-CoA dioxygenase family)